MVKIISWNLVVVFSFLFVKKWNINHLREVPVQSVTKSVETLPPKGAFGILLMSKGKNKAFPSLSSPCSVVLLFGSPIENNIHPNEWRAGERGGDSFVIQSYSVWLQCLNNVIVDCSLMIVATKAPAEMSFTQAL